MTIFGISKPHFTFWKKHYPSCAQDNKTRKQAQYNKTYHLASTEQGICVLDCFFHCYFQDFLLMMHRSVKSFWGWLVILRMLCLHIHSSKACVLAGMFTSCTNKLWFADASESSLGMFTTCPSILTWVTCTEHDMAAAEFSCIAMGTKTVETYTNICTCSSIFTWVGFTVISLYFTEVTSKTRRAQTGSMWCKTIVINARSSILAGRARINNKEAIRKYFI